MTNLLDSLGLNISVTEAGIGSTSDLTWLFLVLKNQSTSLVCLLKIK